MFTETLSCGDFLKLPQLFYCSAFGGDIKTSTFFEKINLEGMLFMKTQIKRNLLCMLIALIMVLGTLPIGVFADTLTGEGTAESPYLIGSASDLKTFRDMVNAEASSTLCAKLTAEINLNNEEWTPFAPASGYVTEAFAGTFDGDGNTIKGLCINSSESNQGLFGVINGATIKNLKVEGSVTSSSNYVGGIVGKVQQGKIENCSFSGSAATTKSSGYAGGITSYAGNSSTQTAEISGCVNTGSISGETKGTVGGIVGYAKYTTISSCYNTGSINGATRSGGIAGQLQNNCAASNCYNTGNVSGSSTASDICDFLYSSSSLTNCFYKTQASGAGTGTTTGCTEITTADVLLTGLGSEYVADTNNINNGYPVLSWQADAASVPKNPSISISGSAVLYMNNNGTTPETTLSVQYTDMEDTPAIIWSVKDNSDIITLEAPVNADKSNSIIIVKAQKPGKATVIAATEDNTYTAELEISVMPFITTVEIAGTAAVGQTVYAQVNVLGGDEYDYENYPELKYQWKYLTAEDYSSGNTGSSSYKDISGSVNRAFEITDELYGQYLSFSLWYDGEYKTPSRPIKVVSEADIVLSADKSALKIDTSDIKESKTLELPSSGLSGSAIIWESSDDTIINPESGVVTLPNDGISEITLTAALSYQGSTVTKEFTVNVYSQKIIDEELAVLANDKSALSLDTSDIMESKTFDLPSSGLGGSEITWKSSDNTIINSENGAVTLPESGVSTVTLTAYLSYNGNTDTKEFTIKVYSLSAIDEAAAILSADKSDLEIDTSDIKEYKVLSLPTLGINGSVIIWESSDNTIISSESGMVTLPESGISTVTLTAVLSYNGITDTKEFVIDVYSLQYIDEAVRVLSADKLSLEIDTANITESKTLELPSSCSGGSSVTWESSDDTIINPKSGEVILPENGISEVTLTAVLSYNGSTDTKEFNINVYSLQASQEANSVLSNDKEALEIDTSDIKASKTIELPSIGLGGSVITWESSDNTVINSKTGAVTLPESETTAITLTAVLSYNGITDTKEFTVTVYSQKFVEEETASKLLKIQNAITSLGEYYKIIPVFGADTNIADILKSDLTEHEYGDIDVSIKSINEVYGGAGIDTIGNITYFYADPNNTPAVRMGRYDVTFSLEYNGVSSCFEVPAIIYWDAEKVKAVMKDEILDKVTDQSIAASNASIDDVTENLELPKIIDDKKWTQISWSSSNENVISISTENQTTADTLFNPYVGVVKQSAADEQVTLTASFTFMLTNDVTGNETPITMSKVFTVTVKAMRDEEAEAIKSQLNEKLNIGFEKAGISDSVTGELLAADNNKYTAYNDLNFPTTRDFGIDGKYYPVSIVSSNNEVIKTPGVNNAARAEVYRPAVGKPDAETTVTVSITDTANNITVSKSFDIIVPALTQDEINAEKALMQKVKALYFDGIKGENTEPDNISQNLNSFIEVYEENGSLVWVRSNENTVNHGIIPVPMDGWEELEAWRLFKSSNPAAVTHENLIVSIQKNAKAVTISSALSSETLGKYGELYKTDPIAYADYAELADLYYQEVSADLVVRGKTTSVNSRPVAVTETIDVSFRLQSSDSALISKVRYKDLSETTTVFDVFKKALADNGYTYKNRGSYVYSITAPDGTTLEELDEGANSGWMYKVNGTIPNVYMGAYGLKDGDEIVVFFTKDYTTEKGYSNNTGFSTSGSNNDTDEQTIAVPAATSAPEENSGSISVKYNDIANHWAEDAINYISGKGLMNGTGGSKFEPDSSLTRAMFVTILYRLEKEPKAQTAQFVDVENGSWYENAVAWANSNGIVKGISDTEFAPNDNITREQIAVIVYRFAALKGYDLTATYSVSYTDASSISDYATEAVIWAASKSIMTGNEDGTFAPQNNTTRAEAAAVFMRIMENLK